jgi:hypothetical protein
MEKVKASNEGLTSASGIAELAREELLSFQNLTESQAKYRIRKARDRCQGKIPTNIDPLAGGIYGSRKRVIAIKIYDKENLYRHLTNEESNNLNNLIHNSVKDDSPEIQKEKMILEEEYKRNNEMTKEEYLKALDKINSKGCCNFGTVQRKFRELYKLQLVIVDENEIKEDFESAF